MSYLLDANVLLRWLETSDPRHTRVKAAIAALENQGHTLHITPQNVIEFWAVASRPTADNGFGWNLPRCDAAVPLLLASFEFLPDTPAIFAALKSAKASRLLIRPPLNERTDRARRYCHRLSLFYDDTKRHYSGRDCRKTSPFKL